MFYMNAIQSRPRSSFRGQGSRRRPRTRGAPGSLQRYASPRPTPFKGSITLSHAFRWLVTGSISSQPITVKGLLASWVVADSATTTNLALDAMRVVRLRLWGEPPALGSTASTVGVEWKPSANTSYAPNQQVLAQSQGVEPAYLSVAPPAESSCGWWFSRDQTNIADTLFTVTLPAGGVLEIVLEMVLTDTNQGVAGPTTTGATAGRFYGYNLGLSSLVPQGLTVLP